MNHFAEAQDQIRAERDERIVQYTKKVLLAKEGKEKAIKRLQEELSEDERILNKIKSGDTEFLEGVIVDSPQPHSPVSRFAWHCA